jgi:hypothetical protein
VTARITAFRPGASPPPVEMAMRRMGVAVGRLMGTVSHRGKAYFKR